MGAVVRLIALVSVRSRVCDDAGERRIVQLDERACAALGLGCCRIVRGRRGHTRTEHEK